MPYTAHLFHIYKKESSMNRTPTRVWALMLLLHAVPAHCATPYFSIRSQSVDASGELVSWQDQINRCDMQGETYGTFASLYKYAQSFNSNDIASSIFGDDVFTVDTIDDMCVTDCPSQIKVSGSDVANRGQRDWLADYFGLPTDFQSVLSFSPTIKTWKSDWNLYIGFGNDMLHNAYFRIHMPIVWTRWNLNFTEEVTAAGVNPHVEGYFSDLAVPRSSLLDNAAQFFTGADAPTITGSTPGGAVENPIGSPITFQKLQYSKFSNLDVRCHCDVVRVSDIEMTLGWNFACSEDYHVGLGIRASAPVGPKPTGEWLFEPVVGSGGNWKLGAQITSHYMFWRSQDDERSFGLWIDANLQHLFDARQVRTFDLAGKPNSRYALAQKLGTNRLPIHLSGISDAGVEWQNEFAPIANLTASSVSVSAGIEANIVAKFAYMSHGTQFDIGYEFWTRSCEKICPTNCCPSQIALNPQGWAVKGDAYVVGFENLSGSANPNVPVRLAGSQNNADIHSGTNTPLATATLSVGTNPGIDNPQLGTTNSVGSPVVREIVLDEQVNSSQPVVFLTEDLIGYGNGTRGLTNKIFIHISHSWDMEDKDWTPYVGLGAAGEFAQSGTGCSATTDDGVKCQLGRCQTCALDQWSIWLKVGLSFQ